MSVNEDLVATCIPEATSLLLVAKQSVREPGECPELRLVALSAYVDDDSLTTGHGAVMSPPCLPLARDVVDG